jgi:hypothetical protein
MAQAIASIQPIKDLDDAHHYLVEELGYEKYPALWEMEACIWDGQLRLTRQRHVDGKPYSPTDGKLYNPEPVNPSFFRSNLKLEFDRHDRVTVMFEWWDFRYRIAEGCDVRTIWPRRLPASQTAPDQQPEDSASPDPFRTGAAGRPSAVHLIKAEAERRIADKEVTPTLGGLNAFSEDLEKWWDVKRFTFKPPGPSMKAGSIKNVVRKLWNAAPGVQN